MITEEVIQRYLAWDKPLAKGQFVDEKGNWCSLTVISFLVGFPEEEIANITVGSALLSSRMHQFLGEINWDSIREICQINNKEVEEGEIKKEVAELLRSPILR